MRKFFTQQLKISKRLTKENLRKLNGKPYYDKYKEGDIILTFIEEKIVSKTKINMVMYDVVERNLNKLKEDFYLVRMSRSIPILRKKEDYGK